MLQKPFLYSWLDVINISFSLPSMYSMYVCLVPVLAYHLVYIYLAVTGFEGYSLYDLPVFNWPGDPHTAFLMSTTSMLEIILTTMPYWCSDMWWMVWHHYLHKVPICYLYIVFIISCMLMYSAIQRYLKEKVYL